MKRTKAEMRELLPYGQIEGGNSNYLYLKAGDSAITLSISSELTHPAVSREIYLSQARLSELATFIEALSARYNYLAAEANEIASRVKLDPLQPISTQETAGQHQTGSGHDAPESEPAPEAHDIKGE